MIKEYKITEAQRLEIVRELDKVPGTRQVANFFDLGLPQQLTQSETKLSEFEKVNPEPVND